MMLPFPNLDKRNESFREQVIDRLMQLRPGYYRRQYLERLKDFALLQSLEIAIAAATEEYIEKVNKY